MPLEPADPQVPARPLERGPGSSRLVPWVLGLGALLFLVFAFNFCVAASGSFSDGESFTVKEREIAKIQGHLSTRDALLDASAEQKEHFSKEGSYTSDVDIVTSRGAFIGVHLSIVLEGPNDYCMEAVHKDSGIVKHITEQEDRPQRGSCPTS